MLRFRLRMEFAAEARDEAMSVLRSLLGPVRAEPGCCATRLLRDVDSERVLTWVEEWRSAADFERHFRAATFRSILAVMELATTRPEVQIDEVASRRGFEFVEDNLERVELRTRTDS